MSLGTFVQCLWRQEENIAFPGARVTDGYELSNVGAGNKNSGLLEEWYMWLTTEPQGLASSSGVKGSAVLSQENLEGK